MKKSLVIINNEKCIKINDKIFCQNIEMKTMPEALNSHFNVRLILRKSKVIPIHEIELNNTSLSSNIFGFIFSILKEFNNNNSKYLIVAITPYTFVAYLLLALTKKKIFLYLRSNGLLEYKLILGSHFVWIYRFMLHIMSKKSAILCVSDRILKGSNYKLVSPSQLNQKWLENINEANPKEIKLLYIGRIKIEKGIFSLLNLYKKINLKLPHTLTLVGHGEKIQNLEDNVKILDPVSKTDELIKIYDFHNITILPSFTEGHPQILLESLARMRPVIIFDEIDFVKKDYHGVFVSQRDSYNLEKIIMYITENYHEIYQLMKKNILPSKEIFIQEIVEALNGE